MAEMNGDRIRERLDELENMDKLLLRAQVLQQRALEILQETVAEHREWQKQQQEWQEQQQEWQERQQEWQERQQEWQERQQKWREEYEERLKRIEIGNAEANDKINFLIDREMRREAGPESHA